MHAKKIMQKKVPKSVPKEACQKSTLYVLGTKNLATFNTLLHTQIYHTFSKFVSFLHISSMFGTLSHTFLTFLSFLQTFSTFGTIACIFSAFITLYVTFGTLSCFPAHFI